MKDSSHLHDARVEKPEIFSDSTKGTYAPINKDGLEYSDVVMVFTTDGVIRMAQYCSNDYWVGEGGEPFGNVTHWYDGYPIPYRFNIDYKRYGGEI